MIPAWLSFVDGIFALALAAAGIVGAHFNLAAPFLGFQLVVFGLLLGVIGLVSGLIGLWRTRAPQLRLARPRAVVGTVASLVVVVPLFLALLSAGRYPVINDITTDTDNPLQFTHAELLPANEGRDMSYPKSFAPIQLNSYGVIAPLELAMDVDSAFKKVAAVAAEMPDWQITYTDPAAHTLEGIGTSRLFHFHDDFVIQVRTDAGGKSLVEMRSKSRVGKGDLGANYKRIMAFFAAMQSPAAKSS